MVHWLRATLELTYVGLVAAAVLIVTGRLGVGAGPLVVLGFAVLAGLAFLGRSILAGVRPRFGVPLGRYLAVTWAGPVVAILVTLLGFDASPGELEAIGGLVGLLAMLNYFLRPVYYAVLAAGRWATDTVS